jgi:hypothetical protein
MISLDPSASINRHLISHRARNHFALRSARVCAAGMQRQSVSGRAGETSGFTDKLVAKVLLRCWHVVSAPNGNAVKHFET